MFIYIYQDVLPALSMNGHWMHRAISLSEKVKPIQSTLGNSRRCLLKKHISLKNHLQQKAKQFPDFSPQHTVVYSCKKRTWVPSVRRNVFQPTYLANGGDPGKFLRNVKIAVKKTHLCKHFLTWTWRDSHESDSIAELLFGFSKPTLRSLKEFQGIQSLWSLIQNVSATLLAMSGYIDVKMNQQDMKRSVCMN